MTSEQEFTKGLIQYLKQFSGSNTNTDDLWNSLTQVCHCLPAKLCNLSPQQQQQQSPWSPGGAVHALPERVRDDELVDVAEGLPADHRQPQGRRGDSHAGALPTDHGQRHTEFQVSERVQPARGVRDVQDASQVRNCQSLLQRVDGSRDVCQRQLQRGGRV